MRKPIVVLGSIILAIALAACGNSTSGSHPKLKSTIRPKEHATGTALVKSTSVAAKKTATQSAP